MRWLFDGSTLLKMPEDSTRTDCPQCRMDHPRKTSDESVVSRVGQVTILSALLGVNTIAVDVLATRAGRMRQELRMRNEEPIAERRAEFQRRQSLSL